MSTTYYNRGDFNNFPPLYDSVIKRFNRGNILDYYLVGGSQELAKGSTAKIYHAKRRLNYKKVVLKVVKHNILLIRHKVTYTGIF